VAETAHFVLAEEESRKEELGFLLGSSGSVRIPLQTMHAVYLIDESNVILANRASSMMMMMMMMISPMAALCPTWCPINTP